MVPKRETDSVLCRPRGYLCQALQPLQGVRQHRAPAERGLLPLVRGAAAEEKRDLRARSQSDA